MTWLPIKFEGSKPQTKGLVHTVNTDCMLGVYSLVYSLVCSEILLTLITGKAMSKSSSYTELVCSQLTANLQPAFREAPVTLITGEGKGEGKIIMTASLAAAKQLLAPAPAAFSTHMLMRAVHVAGLSRCIKSYSPGRQ